MSKFGDLINKEFALILFHDEIHDNRRHLLTDAALELPNNINPVLIDTRKNHELCDSLRLYVHNLPVLMFYKSGEMIIRQHVENSNEIITLIKEKI